MWISINVILNMNFSKFHSHKSSVKIYNASVFDKLSRIIKLIQASVISGHKKSIIETLVPKML